MQITITLSYTARMLVSATGSTPPTAYRIDLRDAAPEHVADHAEEHGITEVTVTAEDIQAHGTVTAAAVAILTAAAPEPAAAPKLTADDVRRTFDSYRDDNPARGVWALTDTLRARGHSDETTAMITRHLRSEQRHRRAERIYRADAARRAADRGMNPNASQPTAAERRDAQSAACAHMTRHIESRLRDARRDARR